MLWYLRDEGEGTEGQRSALCCTTSWHLVAKLAQAWQPTNCQRNLTHPRPRMAMLREPLALNLPVTGSKIVGSSARTGKGKKERGEGCRQHLAGRGMAA